MLHALFVTHGPETCPAAHQQARGVALDGLARLEAEAHHRSATVVGGWADMPGHALYLIVDAPNAHVVSELAMDLGFGTWGTVDVRPVVEVQALRLRLQAMETPA